MTDTKSHIPTELQLQTQLPTISAGSVVELFDAGHFSEDIPLLVDFEGHPVVDPDSDDLSLAFEYVAVTSARFDRDVDPGGSITSVWLETEEHGMVLLDIDDEVPVDVPDNDQWILAGIIVSAG